MPARSEAAIINILNMGLDFLNLGFYAESRLTKGDPYGSVE